MRLPEWLVTARDWSSSQSMYQVGLRLLFGVGLLGSYASIEASIGGNQTWLLYGLVPLAALVVVRPDSGAALVLLVSAMVVWLVAADSDTVSVSALTFALSCLLMHATTAHAALAPPGASFPAATARRWAMSTAEVGAVTVLAWGLARYLTGRHQAGTAWLTGAALVMVLAFVAYLVVGSRADVRVTSGRSPSS